MSKEAPIGLTIVEKLLGLIIILIGVITFFVTCTNIAIAGPLTIFFLAAGLVLIAVGVFILVAKAE